MLFYIGGIFSYTYVSAVSLSIYYSCNFFHRSWLIFGKISTYVSAIFSVFITVITSFAASG